jgi:hypothetical protein
MSGVPPTDPVLDEAHADFIQHHVSMTVASCSAALAPSLVRAFGCRLSADRRCLTVFLALPLSQPVLADLRAGAGIAVVFTRPSTHETLQLKGTGAEIAALADGDRAIMRAYGTSFREELRRLGYPQIFTDAMTAPIEAGAVGVSFVPAAAFVQTPGPAAGQPLASVS